MKTDTNYRTGRSRALIARGSMTAVIVSTDSTAIRADIDNISDSADDIGIPVPKEPGIYLFEGEGKWTSYGVSEQELLWDGVTRCVRPEEIEDLLRMQPPEDKSLLEPQS